MQRHPLFLPLAGLSTGLSLVFFAAALTLTVVSLASPPSSPPPTGGAGTFAVHFGWMGPACMLVFDLWLLVRIVLRRPPARWSAKPVWETSIPSLHFSTALSMVVFALSLWSFEMAVRSIRLDSAHSLTECAAFRQLTPPLWGMGLIFGVLGSQFLWRWSRDVQHTDTVPAPREI